MKVVLLDRTGTYYSGIQELIDFAGEDSCIFTFGENSKGEDIKKSITDKTVVVFLNNTGRFQGWEKEKEFLNSKDLLNINAEMFYVLITDKTFSDSFKEIPLPLLILSTYIRKKNEIDEYIKVTTEEMIMDLFVLLLLLKYEVFEKDLSSELARYNNEFKFVVYRSGGLLFPDKNSKLNAVRKFIENIVGLKEDNIIEKKVNEFETEYNNVANVDLRRPFKYSFYDYFNNNRNYSIETGNLKKLYGSKFFIDKIFSIIKMVKNYLKDLYEKSKSIESVIETLGQIILNLNHDGKLISDYDEFWKFHIGRIRPILSNLEKACHNHRSNVFYFRIFSSLLIIALIIFVVFTPKFLLPFWSTIFIVGEIFLYLKFIKSSRKRNEPLYNKARDEFIEYMNNLLEIVDSSTQAWLSRIVRIWLEREKKIIEQTRGEIEKELKRFSSNALAGFFDKTRFWKILPTSLEIPDISYSINDVIKDYKDVINEFKNGIKTSFNFDNNEEIIDGISNLKREFGYEYLPLVELEQYKPSSYQLIYFFYNSKINIQIDSDYKPVPIDDNFVGILPMEMFNIRL